MRVAGRSGLSIIIVLSLLGTLTWNPALAFVLPPSRRRQSSLSLSRDINGLQEWAQQEGILEENGFSLTCSASGDWSVRVTRDIQAETRLLRVPRDLIWSSTQIREEWVKEHSAQLQPALEYLETQCPLQIPQFFLVLQLLKHVELGSDSRWHAWIQSLPPTFDSAVSMDEVELECLPPLAWSLAQLERKHCQAFCRAIQNITLLSESTVEDMELLKWAFTAVFTRCWAQAQDEEAPDNEATTVDMHMVPMGDMYNHAEPANVVLYYDPEGHCNFFSKAAVLKETPLTLSYGKATNPSRFLTVFGFCDTNQPHIFCQIIVDKTTPQHIELGYTPDTMVWDSRDGSIAPQVWRVVLYSILEQVPALQEAHYKAFASGDTATTSSLKAQYGMEAGIVIKKHVDSTIAELQALVERIDECDDKDSHPRLPLIRLHNVFLRDTFVKVKARLDPQVKAEWERRKGGQ